MEIAVGYLAAYVWRKARRAAGRADAMIDEGLDAGLERLHTAVTDRLGSDDRALARLEQEAGSDLDAVAVPDRTRERVQLALQDEAEDDPAFAALLQELVEAIQAREKQTGTPAATLSASGNRSIAVGGDNSGIASTGDGALNIQHHTPPR